MPPCHKYSSCSASDSHLFTSFTGISRANENSPYSRFFPSSLWLDCALSWKLYDCLELDAS